MSRLAPDESQKVISRESCVADEGPHDASPQLSMPWDRKPASLGTNQNHVAALRVVP